MRQKFRSLAFWIILMICGALVLGGPAESFAAKKAARRPAAKSTKKAVPKSKKGSSRAKTSSEEAAPEAQADVPLGAPDSVILTQAEEFRQSMHFREALPLFQRLALQGADPVMRGRAAYFAGDCYYQMEDPEHSIPWFLRALVGDPERTEKCYYRLGMASSAIGNAQAAQIFYQRVVKYFPASSETVKNAKMKLEGLRVAQ